MSEHPSTLNRGPYAEKACQFMGGSVTVYYNDAAPFPSMRCSYCGGGLRRDEKREVYNRNDNPMDQACKPCAFED